MPLVSVLLPVYNGEAYLRESIESILNQTFTDFEFFIIDDGSTDNSLTIINEYSCHDNRIHFYKNDENMGISKTLNHGISLANGKYIARMDSDDLSRPNRLQRQVEFMESHPDIGICGSWIEVIGSSPKIVMKFPKTNEEIQANLLFSNPIAHPSVMMRSSLILANDLFYDASTDFKHVEDYELWTRSAKITMFTNIAEVLLDYRIHPDSVSKSNSNLQVNSTTHISQKMVASLLGEMSPEEITLHNAVLSNHFLTDRGFLAKTEIWLLKIRNANLMKHRYDNKILNNLLEYYWNLICDHVLRQGQFPIGIILSSSFRFHNKSGLPRLILVLRRALSTLYR